MGTVHELFHRSSAYNYGNIASDNNLSPVRCQANIWTNAGKLLMKYLQWNLNQNAIIFIKDKRLKIYFAK